MRRADLERTSPFQAIRRLAGLPGPEPHATMTPARLTLWFTFVVALGLAGRWQAFSARAERCALDGNRIVPVYRVDLVEEGAVQASFCCVRCAVDWPEAGAGARWRVRDEVTGEPLDATKACFVESTVVTIPSRQSTFHTFADWADALEHAESFGGRRIENPLAPSRASSRPPAASPPSRDSNE